VSFLKLVPALAAGCTVVLKPSPYTPLGILAIMISAAQADGATLAYGGGRPGHLPKGYFLNPTLFTGVDNSVTIAQREVFGPVQTVPPFKDEDDAIRIAKADCSA
jgi:acyl-CoA reductase-like NAD-dependent aldehyde dehydrogenase